MGPFLGKAGMVTLGGRLLAVLGNREGQMPPREDGQSPLWRCSLDTVPLVLSLGRPCTCNPAGSRGTCDPRSGRCPCKENVEGNLCDRWVSRSSRKPAGSDLSAGSGGRGRGVVLTDRQPPRGTLPGAAPRIGRPRSYLKVLMLFIL